MSWYNLDGTTVQASGLEDLLWHDVLRIPNWPTQQDASNHPYKLNAAQGAALIGENAGVAAANPSAALTPAGAVSSSAGGQSVGQAILPNLATWFTRIAEIALGIVLIAVGVAKLTGAVPIATKIAGAVA
jgi:hypothetical protein